MLEMARTHTHQGMELQSKVAADLGIKEMATHACKPRKLSSRGHRAPTDEDNTGLAEKLHECQTKTMDFLEVANFAETGLQKMYKAALIDDESLALQNKTVPFCPESPRPQPAADKSVKSTVVTRDIPRKWHEQSIDATEHFQRWLHYMSAHLMTELFQGRTDRAEFTSDLVSEISERKEEIAALENQLAYLSLNLEGKKNGTATTATVTPKFQNATATASLVNKPASVNSTAGYHPSSSKGIPGYHPSSVSSSSSAPGYFAESSSVRFPVKATSKAPIYPVMSESKDVQAAKVTAAPSQASYVPTSSEEEDEEEGDEE